MTKLRTPLTPQSALLRIVALLGWDGCASLTGKSESTIKKYADHDAERELSLLDAMRLDAAYRRTGGDGLPLFETYAARMEMEAASPGEAPKLLDAIRDAVKESSEAIDATLAMTSGGNRKQAVREVSEAIEAFTRIKVRLQGGSNEL